MKNTKKFLALLMAMAMVMALAACGSKEEPAPAEQPAGTQEEQAPVEETTPDTDMSYVQDKGVLVVGITDFEPILQGILCNRSYNTY